MWGNSHLYGSIYKRILNTNLNVKTSITQVIAPTTTKTLLTTKPAKWNPGLLYVSFLGAGFIGSGGLVPYQPRGNYSISLKCADDGWRFVPAGIYFYTMKTEKQMITKKMVLLK